MSYVTRCAIVIVIFSHVVSCYNDVESLSDKKDARYSSRIVGGKAASITDYAYIAFVAYYCDVTYYTLHHCGGAIIGKKWILTAAHCPGNVTTQPEVYVGSNKMYEGTLYLVKRSVQHDKYKVVLNIGFYDIMVLELTEDLKLGPKVRLIALGKDTDHVDKKMAAFAGFGLDRDPREPNTTTIACGLLKIKLKDNSKLLAVKLPIISHDRCRALKYHEQTITTSTFCAGYTNGAKGPCNGDSGSPLVSNGRVIGILSCTVGKCGTNPGVFVSVPLTTTWILNVTGKL